MAGRRAKINVPRRGMPVEARLGLLRDELFEQAYALERQGRVDAADAVIGVAGRIEEWCSELEQSTVQVRVD